MTPIHVEDANDIFESILDGSPPLGKANAQPCFAASGISSSTFANPFRGGLWDMVDESMVDESTVDESMVDEDLAVTKTTQSAQEDNHTDKSYVQ